MEIFNIYVFRNQILFYAIEITAMNKQSPTPRHFNSQINLTSIPRSMVDVTEHIDSWLKEINATNGLITIFLKHTSASLTIQENTDVDVQYDLLDILDELAPAERNWRHSLEGSDDMPAHVKSVLIGSNLAVPVVDGRLDLGTWQSILFSRTPHTGSPRYLSLHYTLVTELLKGNK